MKKSVFFLIIVLFSFSCVKKQEIKQAEVKKISNAVVVLTEKEIFLNSLSPENKSFVQKIDSMGIGSYLAEKKTGKNWSISTPCHNEWTDNVYEDESGELLKTLTYESHIGKAYLKEISARQIWENYSNNEIVLIRDFTMKYGVLLSPDTLGNKVFPAGTFVTVGFTENKNYSHQQVFYKYLSDYNKFEEAVWSNTEADDVYPWGGEINGYNLTKVIIWI